MLAKTTRLPLLALALSLPLTACETGTGVDGDPAARAETTVLLSQGASPSFSLSPSLSEAVLESAGPVALSDVKAIEVTITKVQAIRADSAAADSVVSLEVTAGGKLDLLALPTTAASGIQLARGTLPEGTYRNLRLFFSSATVTFARDVRVGGGPAAKTYAKDVAQTLEIPGAAQTGIIVPTGSFTVAKDAGSTVSVAFDGSASVKKVIATPAGIKMVPVLTGSAESKGKGQGKGGR